MASDCKSQEFLAIQGTVQDAWGIGFAGVRDCWPLQAVFLGAMGTGAADSNLPAPNHFNLFEASGLRRENRWPCGVLAKGCS